MPALVESSFRRGTDILKYHGRIGRVLDGHIWSLGASNQPGVERVLEILRVAALAVTQQVGDLPAAPKNIAERRDRDHPVDGISREVSASGGCYGP